MDDEIWTVDSKFLEATGPNHSAKDKSSNLFKNKKKGSCLIYFQRLYFFQQKISGVAFYPTASPPQTGRSNPSPPPPVCNPGSISSQRDSSHLGLAGTQTTIDEMIFCLAALISRLPVYLTWTSGRRRRRCCRRCRRKRRRGVIFWNSNLSFFFLWVMFAKHLLMLLDEKKMKIRVSGKKKKNRFNIASFFEIGTSMKQAWARIQRPWANGQHSIKLV